MGRGSSSTAVWRRLGAIFGLGLLVLWFGPVPDRSAAAGNAPTTQTTKNRKVPRLSAPPANPKLMQVYYNTQNKREWIYDGAQWVPHDDTVDDYYAASATTLQAGSLAAPLAAAPATCPPTGAHAKHNTPACTTCHLVKGAVCFDPAGPAVASGKPAPSFDPNGKACSNVACHGMYSGYFTYSTWDWGCDCPVDNTVPYAGSGGSTSSWYSTGSLGCAACHGNPPRNYAWHAANHGLPSAAKGPYCETCHPDAVGGVVGGQVVGVAINTTYASLHSNGALNVQAKFTSKCFGCH